jgi:hypothetical protein
MSAREEELIAREMLDSYACFTLPLPAYAASPRSRR